MVTAEMLARLCRAREVLREEQECPPSIGALAREAALSPDHFIRLFRATFGETPHQLRIDARLERARHLLHTGERSVTEVCMEVGFSSLGSFSDLFARRVGVAPSAYRRRAMVQVPVALRRPLIPGCFGLMCGLPAWE